MRAQDDAGARLREARLERRMSLRSVAQALGVSASLISQVETGKTQPSVSTLWALVTHLGISLDDLLGGVQATAATVQMHDLLPGSSGIPPVQRFEENPMIEMENGVRWERLAMHQGGPADAFLVTYEPGASSSIEGKLMRHAGIEFAFLIEGELNLQLDFDSFVVRAGDSLHLDSVRPHMYSNRGPIAARGVWFVVGRRQQNSTMPAAPVGDRGAQVKSLGSAVDVLRAMDDL